MSIEQIDDMKHATGFQQREVKDGAYKACRNFFAISKPSESREEPVSGGYASKRNSSISDEIVYSLSTKGFTVLAKILSVKLIFEQWKH